MGVRDIEDSWARVRQGFWKIIFNFVIKREMALKVKETQSAVAIVTWGDRIQDEGQQAEDTEQKCIKTWAPDSIQKSLTSRLLPLFNTFMEE